MGRRDKKKKGGGAQPKPGPSAVDREDILNIEGDDDGTLKADDLPIISRLITSSTKQLGRIATEFLEAFDNRCQLSLGSALVLAFEYLSSTDRKQERRLILPRIIIVYLVYRVRDLEPWLRRKADKSKDNIQGHIFMEFFLRLARDDYEMPNFAMFSLIPTALETKMARMILGRRAAELQSMTANDVFNTFSKASFTSPDPVMYDSLMLGFENQSKRWPNDLDTDGCPGIILTAPIEGPEPIADMTPEEMAIELSRIFGIDIFSIPGDYDVSPPPFLTSGRSTWERNLHQIRRLNVVKMEMKQDINPGAPPPQPDNLDFVSMDDGQQPQSSTTFSMTEREKSPLYEMLQKMIKGEVITQLEFNCAHDYVYYVPDSDEFFEEVLEMAPIALNNYIEQHVGFCAELVCRIVKNDPSRVSIHIFALMEMGFSVKCIEIVLRLYKSIRGLPSDILIEYLNSLMTVCESTTSSSQKVRYVRIFSSFAISILNEGALRHQADDNTKSALQTIQAFALRNNEHREATILFQKIQEVLRKWESP